MVRWNRFKRRLIGLRPLASDELEAELLPKTLALPVFASDPLSSVAYASEESMLVLALAGASAFDLLTPISLVIATVLTLVVISYRPISIVGALPHLRERVAPRQTTGHPSKAPFRSGPDRGRSTSATPASLGPPMKPGSQPSRGSQGFPRELERHCHVGN